MKNEPHSQAEQAACPACGQPTEVAALRSYQRCAACALRFAWPMDAGSREWYDESGIYSGESIASDLPPLSDARHLAFFERAETPGQLLDLGCGAGVFLRHASSRGFEVAGVEFQPELAERAREHELEVETCDLVSALRAGTARFDFITAFDVLEHLEEPALVVELMLARLRPGGICAVTVPHADRVPASFDPVVDAPPHHLTLWTVEALGELFQRQGASACEVRELPLTAEDLLLHYLWKRHGHQPARTTRWDGLARRKLALQVGLWNALGRSRGHTLVAFASARD